MIAGKVAVVTGAGKGIGRKTAFEFAKAGAKVVLVGHKPDSIGELHRYLAELGFESITIAADVSDFGAVSKMAEQAKDKYGRIDILVNNAGIASTKTPSWHVPLLEIDDREWDRVLAVNLKGQFNCAKAVVPYMMEQNDGSIINIGSTTALSPTSGSAAFCASKAGVMALTRVLAKELASYRIRVNCIAPGLTLTPAQDSVSMEAIDTAAGTIPLGRAGLPSDVAQVILFFASDGTFVTGQTLLVDGGGTMH
ncbi:MAG: 3-oxoacyl-(acyl-carrier-protein) reductase FabG [Syntrophorhabdaceae bacterium PtaU1.Bin034]|nr:MAG: 3-oxoacyl-(acyl-carrier-protein) reductase FabG [Syntrophorhabdaceae bacterium PtaU1.Bin034]